MRFNYYSFAFSVLFGIGELRAQEGIQKVEGFLPEIVSQFPNVRDAAISVSGDEIYFTVQSYLGELSAIVVSKFQDGKYSYPEVAPFSGKYHDLEPFLAPDGLRLYFSSNRPLEENSNETKDYDIWFVERVSIKSSWSAPYNMGYPINTKDNEFYPAVSKFNNLYFTSDGAQSKGKDDIFVSIWNFGSYDLPVSLSDSINSDGIEFNAYIAPDESYLIYTCYNRDGGYGSGDLYISYQTDNGRWTKAMNMGPQINSPKMDYCPFIDPKKGMLYFTSKRNAVQTKFNDTQALKKLLEEMTQYENGLSRLYKIKFDPNRP
ncbi:MAG TPA: exo-alpha-sialidase [Saprospiraceae bacterium]|nr:exo-alpha-sialidase [Saprospiraceae bacterium]